MPDAMSEPSADAPAPHAAPEPPRGRIFAGGFLMGFANLVPGVSGGTMILALGLYDNFIGWVASLTRMQWSRALFVSLSVFAVGLFIAVIGLATPAKYLVEHHRWVMYSLFIGMTFGGVPELFRVIRRFDLAAVLCASAGIGAMALLSFAATGGNVPHTTIWFLIIGALGASSMILPGVSGSLILLMFGFYSVVIGSLSPSVFLEDPAGAAAVLAPFLVGVALGIALLSNVLKVLLARFSHASHAALLGLLLGSAFPLYPFQDAVWPELLDRSTRKAIELVVVDGATDAEVLEERGVEVGVELRARWLEEYAGLDRNGIKRRSQELETFAPGGTQVLLALGLLAAGFVATRAIGVREKD